MIYKKHTTYYKSPKIILKYNLDKTYDYWSIGCTIYELITGEIMFDPFDSEIEDVFGEVEDRNLMYLISCAIGIPNNNILNNSKQSDIFFTSDKLCLRGYNIMKFNPFIDTLINYGEYLNKTNTISQNYLFELIQIVSLYINYNMLFE